MAIATPCAAPPRRYAKGVPPTDRPRLALALRLASSLALATMFMLAKLAGERGASLPEIMFARQATTLPMLLGWLLVTGGLYRLRTRRIGAHMRRSVMGTLGMVSNFGAVLLLHLSEATTISFTSPLFAVVLTALVFKDHVGPWRWSAVAFGFVGVVLVARPDGTALPALGASVALCAAMLNALVSFEVRDLGRTEPAVTIVFWFATMGVLFAAPFMPFFYRPHDGETWLLLLGIGAAGTIGQLLMTSALRYGPVASVIVMDYMQLLWATVYGQLIWGELPHGTTWLGAPLIVCAGLVIAWREHVRARAGKAPARMPPAV